MALFELLHIVSFTESNRMGKTLHIMPAGALWSKLAYGWIGKELKQHDILPYPVQTNIHYLPEDFSETEMMKVAIS